MQQLGGALTLVDQMTAPIQEITFSMNEMTRSMTEITMLKENAFGEKQLVVMRNATQELSSNVLTLSNQTEAATQKQNEANEATEEAETKTTGLAKKLDDLAKKYLNMKSLKALVGLSDDVQNTKNKLDQIGVSFDDVTASAMSSRTDLLQTGNAIAEMGLQAGSAFNNNNELITFTETVSKACSVAGASATEMEGTMSGLTKVMATGVMDESGLDSLLSGAPQMMEYLAEEMGTTVEGVRELAAESGISAEVLKSAFLNASGEVAAEFDDLPYTWENIFTQLQTVLLDTFEPLLQIISDGAQWVGENWETIQPILAGVATAVGALAAVYGIWTIATKIQKLAQDGLNTAMFASPITWVLLIVLALIGVVYAVVAAINHFAGTSISATGIIIGAFAVLAAFIWNTIAGVVNAVIGIGVELWNLIATFANYFGNVFNDPVAAIVNLFSGMFDFILGIVQSAAKLIDTVLGSDMSGAVAGFRNTVAEKTTDLVGEQPEVLKKLDASDYQLNRIGYKDSFNAGYGFGENMTLPKAASQTMSDYQSPEVQPEEPAGIQQTADNTKSIADSMDVTTDVIEYMRDVAERESINRFTTAEVNVNFGDVNNTVNNEADLDGIVDHITRETETALSVMAEGVNY